MLRAEQSDRTIATSWNGVVEGVLAHAKSTGPALVALLEAQPDCVRAHALKGLSALLLGKAEGRAVAKQAVTTAEALLRQGAGWDQDIHYIRAIRLWLDGRPLEAATALDHVLDRTPDDALAAKLSQSIRFMFGDRSGMLTDLASRIGGLAHPSNPFKGYMLGCFAFALEENGEYGFAERLGRQAVDIAPRDAWGRHAVAHVHEMTGRTAAGLDWLRDAAHWEHCNNFGYHMWWHLALFELESGRFHAVLDLYDQRIRADRTDDFRDIANAASLLQRLELEGVPVGARWQELSELAAHRIDDHCTVFGDLHYLMALAGAGDRAGAQAFADSLMAHALGASETSAIARDVGVGVADAIIAFSEGRYGAVVDRLLPLWRRLHRLGNSEAQRDVFEQILIEAAVRSQRAEKAQRLLQSRLARRNGANRFALDRLARLAGLGNARLAVMAAAVSARPQDRL